MPNPNTQRSQFPNESSHRFARLRQVLDSNDPFMGAFQVVGPIVVDHSRSTPEWMFNNLALRQFLVEAFPKHKTNKKQRRRMGLWAWVIQLYFRMALKEKAVESELRGLLREMGLRTTTQTWARKNRGRKVYSWASGKKVLVRVIPGRIVEVKARRTPVSYIVQQIRRRMRGLRLDGKPRGRGRGHRSHSLVLTQ
jgi:hypothetical protein